jgi:hypothetical protein
VLKLKEKTGPPNKLTTSQGGERAREKREEAGRETLTKKTEQATRFFLN